MDKSEVVLSPLAGRALVYTRERVYCLRANEEEVREEAAPHMHNLHTDRGRLEFTTDEDYPFPKLKKQLVEEHAVSDTMTFLLLSLDGEVDIEVRFQTAEVASKIFGNSVVAKRVAKIMLETPLPRVADFNGEVLAKMSVELRKLLEDTRDKWWSKPQKA